MPAYKTAWLDLTEETVVKVKGERDYKNGKLGGRETVVIESWMGAEYSRMSRNEVE